MSNLLLLDFAALIHGFSNFGKRDRGVSRTDVNHPTGSLAVKMG